MHIPPIPVAWKEITALYFFPFYFFLLCLQPILNQAEKKKHKSLVALLLNRMISWQLVRILDLIQDLLKQDLHF